VFHFIGLADGDVFVITTPHHCRGCYLMDGHWCALSIISIIIELLVEVPSGLMNYLYILVIGCSFLLFNLRVVIDQGRYQAASTICLP
jgi:hypothetical protein